MHHLAGAALADLLPKSAESSAARDAVNERTSNLPTFGDVGAALKKSLGQNDPKDIGRAIDANTPGAAPSPAAPTRVKTMQALSRPLPCSMLHSSHH
jgi:hypothetical protein